MTQTWLAPPPGAGVLEAVGFVAVDFGVRFGIGIGIGTGTGTGIGIGADVAGAAGVVGMAGGGVIGVGTTAFDGAAAATPACDVPVLHALVAATGAFLRVA